MICIASRRCRIDPALFKALQDIQKEVKERYGKDIELTTASSILAGRYWGINVTKEALANDRKTRGKKPIRVLNL